MKQFKSHIIVLMLMALAVMNVGVSLYIGIEKKALAQDNFDTSFDLGNDAPVITVTPSDGGSDTTTPTNAEGNVTFTATGADANSDDYYLAICKTDAVTAQDNAAPTCDGGAWAISVDSTTDPTPSPTYTTLVGDFETNAWYAFVCDKVSGGGTCFPGATGGDQGSALGTITFTGVPEDGDTITVDSVIYEFDTNATYTNILVDISGATSTADVAVALQTAEAGLSSNMAVRGSIVYVYANTAGATGNSIAMTEPNANEGGSTDEITLSGATLSGGSNSNASPFYVNHAPTFGTVTVTDQLGGEINPGDSLRFTLPAVQIADADTQGGQDYVKMTICTDATTSFIYGAGTCVNGSPVCTGTAMNPNLNDATCDESGNTLVPPSDTGGTENFKVYVYDTHDFYDSGATNQQSYTIVNTAPTHDDPELDIHAATLPNSVGYWQFEDGQSAVSFDDETTNENNGTCTNCPDWTAEGYSGGAYVFDRIASDYIDIPTSTDFDVQNLTISTWVYSDNYSQNMFIFEQGNVNTQYSIFIESGSLIFRTKIPGGALDDHSVTLATAGISNSNWYHVLATYDGSYKKIYVNGVEKGASKAYTQDLVTGLGTAGRIGAYGGAPNYHFDGIIDELHIYNRALTADEVAQQYAAYTGALETDLTHYWKFDESTVSNGITVYDSVGGADGTMSTAEGTTEKSATGYSNKAIDFDGSDDYLYLGNTVLFDPDVFTFSAWIYPETGMTMDRIIVHNPTTNSNTSKYFDLYINNSKLIWGLYKTGGVWGTQSTPIAFDTWSHAVAVYDGSNAYLYLNGELVDSIATGLIAYTGAFDTYIGNNANNLSEGPFKGKIDEVRIYDNDLSATEVQQLYYASKYHDSNQDLSCKVGNIDDHDLDATTTIFNWEKDGTSTAVLNMPFDSDVTVTIADAVVDYSGTGNHGTLGGASPAWSASGIKGGAYDFNGTDDYIDIPDSVDFDVNNIAVEAWFKTSTTGQNMMIVGRDPLSNCLTNANRSYYLRITDANVLEISVYDHCTDAPTQGEDYEAVLSTSTVTDGNWHHVVGQWDGTTVEMYLDGVSEGSTSFSGTLNNVTQSVRIGKSQHTSSFHYFDGMIDEVRIYDTALSAEQIAQNYNNGIPLYNTIVNQETDEADVSWQCKVTVNDASDDSATNSSNTIDPSNSEPVQNFPSTRAHALLDTNSVGYWQFEGGDLTSNILDETANNNDGSCTNCPAWTAEGAIGGGYEFDGVDDVVVIPDVASLGLDTWTINAWIKMDDYDFDNLIVMKGGTTTGVVGDDDHNNYTFKVRTDGYLEGRYGTETAVVDVNSTVIIDLNTWYFVSYTYDGSNAKIYINGSLDNITSSTVDPYNQNENVYIGEYRWKGAVYHNFDGIIDELHIYGRALDATEIANLYNSRSYVYGTMDLGAGTRDMSDADDDDLFATVDWRESDTSIAVLNMSFNKSVTSTLADAVLDYSTYTNHGQLGGGTATSAPTWANATTCGNDSGGCYDFDGTTDYINVGSDTGLDDLTQKTISAWIYMDGWGENGSGRIASKNPDNISAGWSFYTNDGTGAQDRLGFIQIFGGNDAQWYTPDVSLSLSAWTHVVLTFDSSSDTNDPLMYINGINQTVNESIAPSGTANSDAAYDVWIGARSNGAGDRYFDGKIDEFQIYDSILSIAQIQSMYNAGKPNYQNIAYGETVVGETWKSLTTITEGNSESSVTLESNEVEILGFSTDVAESHTSGTVTESSDSIPTNAGIDIDFKGIFNTAGNAYYLAICKTNAITAGALESATNPPTCDGGNWAISDPAVSDNTQATTTYTTSGSDVEQNVWYTFACENLPASSGPLCSPSTQGTGNSGSPFVVNHAPAIGTVTVGDTTGGGGLNPATGNVDPGDTLYFNAAITDSNSGGTQDTINVYFCETSGFTYGASPACTGTLICSDTGVDPTTDYAECDDSGNPQVPLGTSSGSVNFYVYTQDSHDFAGTGTNLQNYTVQNAAPVITAGSAEEWDNTTYGDFWFDQVSGTTENIEDIYFLDSATGYAAGLNGVILKTTDAGRNWADVFPGSSGNFKDIYCSTTDLCWAVGETGIAYRTDDGGDTWDNWNHTPAPAGWIYDIYFVDSTCQSGLSGCTGWLVNSGSYVSKTTDGGTTWVAQTEPFSAYVLTVYCTDEASQPTCWAADNDGNIARKNYNSSIFSAQTSPVASGLLQIQFIDSTCTGGNMTGCTGWIVGYGGVLLKTTNGGVTWTQDNPGNASHIYDIHFLDVNNGWLNDFSGRVMKTTDGGDNWSYQSVGNSGLYGLHMVDANTGWSSGLSGEILAAGNTVTESSDINPTHDGLDVTFTATATDANSDQYYLAVCRTNSITPGTSAAPTCATVADTWSISTVTNSGVEASVSYTTGSTDETGCTGAGDDTCPWYAFICDYNASATCSSASQGTGNSGSPFVINHAPTFVDTSFGVSDTSVTEAIPEILVDGSAENSGVGDWISSRSAVLTKETGTPHGGDQVLKVANGGTAWPYASQDVMTTGKTYRITGWMRGDGGSGYPRIIQQEITVIRQGSVSNTWQYFDNTFVAIDDTIGLGGSASGYAEYDDVHLMEVNRLVDGDMEDTGTITDIWTIINSGSGTVSKQATNPHGGSQVMRIERTSAGSPGAYQGITTVGEKYRITGWTRTDGTNGISPVVYDGATLLWTGTLNGTSWQYFDITYMAGSTNPILYTITYNGYTEWDDVTIREAGSSEPGEQSTFYFEVADTNSDPNTVVVCDSAGFNDSTRACTTEELCRASVFPGNGWEAQSSGATSTLYGMSMLDANNGFAVGGAEVFKTVNGGSTWTKSAEGTGSAINDVFCNSTTDCYAVGNGGQVIKYNGTWNWTTENAQALRSVFFVSSTTGWFTGDNGQIEKTTNSGSTWLSQTSNVGVTLWGLECSDANTCYAVGEDTTNSPFNGDAVIVKTTNGGTAWAQSDSNLDSLKLYAVDVIDANTVYASGESGAIVKTTNGGTNWTQLTSGTTSHLLDVDCIDASTCWFVGGLGGVSTVLYTDDGGSSFTEQTSVADQQLWDVEFINSTTGWLAGANGTIEGTTSAGSTGGGSCTETDTDDLDSEANPVYIGIPEAHGMKAYTIHTFDENNLVDDGQYEDQYNLYIEDTLPYVSADTDYSVTDVTLTAGWFTDKTYTVTLKDDNGDDDLVDTHAGYLYDTNAISLSNGSCTPTEANCYTDSNCVLSNNTSGTDNEATATCAFTCSPGSAPDCTGGNTVWFNANGSANWKLFVDPVDGQGLAGNTIASTDIDVATLAAINVIETNIAYGTIELGRSSAGQTTTIENLGNQTFDLTVQGDDMCTDYPGCIGNTILKTQQKYHNTNSAFNWAQEGSTLVGTPLSGCTPAVNCDETYGCVNRDIGVRSVHGTGSTDENFYLKILIPAAQTPGSYTGQNTIGTTADDSCIGTLY